MYVDNEKVILTDVDGVLLDWEYAFNVWMDSQGYERSVVGKYDVAQSYGLMALEGKHLVKMFNESAHIGFLPPLRDSMYYMKKLHEEHGYIFHVITSLTTNQYACELRTRNLRKLFGESTFEKFIYLDTGADKDEVLAKYKDTGCYWVEDKMTNVDEGIKNGLKGLLVAHNHNVGYNGEAQRVSNWKDIYEIITG